jgi:hypothetical protein
MDLEMRDPDAGADASLQKFGSKWRCLVSNLQTRVASIGVAFKKPKLLIFPFLVRTNDEGVFRAFSLGGEGRFARDCGGAGYERGWNFA